MAQEAGCVDDEVISATLARIEDDDDEVVDKYCMNEILSHVTLKDNTEDPVSESDPDNEESEEESKEITFEKGIEEMEEISTDEEESDEEEESDNNEGDDG